MKSEQRLQLPSAPSMGVTLTAYEALWHSENMVMGSVEFTVSEGPHERCQIVRSHVLEKGRIAQSDWSIWSRALDSEGRSQHIERALVREEYPQTLVEGILDEQVTISPLAISFAAYELFSLCTSLDEDLKELAFESFRSKKDIHYVSPHIEVKHVGVQVAALEARLAASLSRPEVITPAWQGSPDSHVEGQPKPLDGGDV